jgi:tight adherence protein C
MAELLNGAFAFIPIIGAILLFVAVVLIVVGVGAMLQEFEFMQRRLAGPRSPIQEEAPSAPRSILIEDNLLKRIDNLVTPKNLDELSKIRKRLIQAGYRKPSAVRVFYLSKAVLALGFAVVTAMFIPFLAGALPLPVIGLVIITAMLLGYIMPSFWVERRIEYRRIDAELGFPDLLDMLLICIEAGNGLDQASRRVTREIKIVNPVLADELGVVNDELYAGKSRAAVFRDFADRLQVPDISAFAAVLRQSDEFGVSIAETLRVYAAELRDKRVMRAEEKANLMPIKLALGSIAFTIPPTMLIMAGPSVIMILRTFAGLGG